MSAISETEIGAEMVCIINFEAWPRDAANQPIYGERRAFSIGERVRYVGQFFVDKPKDNPIGHMALFKPNDPADSKIYGAVHHHFVSIDLWENLQDHFASNLIVIERDVRKRTHQKTYMLMKIKNRSRNA